MELSRKTIGACLEDTARRTPDKTAVICDGFSYTWAEINNCSNYMAYRMFNMRIGRGTHVGIWGVNSPNWVIVYLALVKIGAVPVLINTCYQERELTEVLSYADVEYLYYGEDYKNICYADVVASIRAAGKCAVKSWVYMGRDKDGEWLKESSFVSSERAKKAVHLVRCLQKEVYSQDVAGMLFTSGTTATPKGVLLTHYNLVNTARATIGHMGWTKEDRICIALPLFHCFGLTSSMLTTVLLGSTMCILPYYRTAMVLGCVQRHRCTILNGVPSAFLAMIKNPDFGEYDTSSLKSGIIAGSSFYPKDFERISRMLPTLKLIPSYGQTETSPAVSFASCKDSVRKRALNGSKIIEGVELKVVDIRTGDERRAGETGEVMVRGYNVMKGYYALPEITKQTISEDGWLDTGDLGYLDPEGYLYIKGRRKEVIIRAGENISPGEITELLLEIPWIEQAAVIGIPAEVIQEKVVACVILKQGEKLREDYIRSYLSERLAHYKVPEDYLVFGEFPVTESGKLKLDELKKMASEQLGKGNRQN